MKTLLLLIPLVSLALTGCGTLNTAKNNQFACKGSNCPTPLEVYSETGGNPAGISMGRTPSQWSVSTDNKKASRDERRRAREQQRELSNRAVNLVDGPSTQANAVVASSGGLAQPLRTPPQIMRVWIAPWIDKQDNLHMNGFVFTEVASRKWSFGSPEIRATDPLSMTMPVPVN